MAANNSLNISTAGIVKFDGVSVFSADTTTDHSVLVGAAANGITSIALTNGQLLIGSTGVDPVASTITAGTNVSVTNAAGSITLATSTAVASSFPTDSGTATPAANALSIVGGPGVTVTGAGSTVTINSVVYTDQGGSVTVTSDSGSFATAAITLTLPAAPANGEECRFVVTSAAVLTVTANAGQTIQLGSTVTAVAGTAASSATGDTLWLTYRSTNTRWYSVCSTGTWTLT